MFCSLLKNANDLLWSSSRFCLINSLISCPCLSLRSPMSGYAFHSAYHIVFTCNDFVKKKTFCPATQLACTHAIWSPSPIGMVARL